MRSRSGSAARAAERIVESIIEGIIPGRYLHSARHRDELRASLEAAHPVDAAVDFVGAFVRVAGEPVQSVDILSDQPKSVAESRLQRCDRLVSRIGLSPTTDATPVEIPTPYLPRVPREGTQGGELLRVILLRPHGPIAFGSAKGWNTALGRNPCPGKNRDPARIENSCEQFSQIIAVHSTNPPFCVSGDTRPSRTTDRPDLLATRRTGSARDARSPSATS